MIRTEFKSQEEFASYIAEQKQKMEQGELTRSEREKVKQMLLKDYKPTIQAEEKETPVLITNLAELRKPCLDVTKEDNLKDIVQQLKTTLNYYSDYGISANQIGISKKVSYIRYPKYNPETKKLDLIELVLINAKIVEKSNPIKVQNEACLSFRGVPVHTKRYVFCTVEYVNEKLEPQTLLSQDLEAIIIQHEVDHQCGRTIFDNKWTAK